MVAVLADVLPLLQFEVGLEPLEEEGAEKHVSHHQREQAEVREKVSEEGAQEAPHTRRRALPARRGGHGRPTDALTGDALTGTATLDHAAAAVSAQASPRIVALAHALCAPRFIVTGDAQEHTRDYT